MAERKIKFVSLALAARIFGRFGWRSATEKEIHDILAKPVPWTMADRANLQRMADSLERIAKALNKAKA